MPLAVYTTFSASDLDAARALARGAVEAGLAACVQIDRIESVYLWEGVQQDPEIRLLFKVSSAGYDRLAAHVLDAHPYDEPALWAVEMARGSDSFLRWIDANSGG